MSHLSSHAEIKRPAFTGRVWRSEDGKACATVELNKASRGDAWFTFDDPADARDMAVACTRAAEAMERLAAEPGDSSVLSAGEASQ